MIYDLLIIVTLLLSVYIGYKCGGAKMLMSLLGSLVSFLLATFLGNYISTFIYDSIIKDSVISSVTMSLSDSTAGMSNAVDSLPAFVSFVCNICDVDISSTLKSAVSDIPSAVATSVEEALKPVVLSILTFILTAVIFIVVYFIFRVLLSKILLSVFKLPLLRTLNSFVGVICSLLSVLLFISFIAFLLRLLMPYITDIPYVLSESTIYNSYIFYHFYSGNIFSSIISLF